MIDFLKTKLSELVQSAINFNRKIEINNLLSEERLIVGDYTYGVNNLSIHNYKGSESNVIIGKYCSLAPNITIITGGIHPVDWVSTYPFRVKFDLEEKFEDGMPYSKGDIIIGNDVWIGTGVVILSGIKIGDGAVIAAGSVIVKDVPAYAIAGGNPAKIIRFRFSEVQIENLLTIKWWNWDQKRIVENLPIFCSRDINDLIDFLNE